MTVELRVEDHPALLPRAQVIRFPARLGEDASPVWLVELLRPGSESPWDGLPDEEVRAEVRDALRHHGYRPTGRGKPASEYLLRAAEAGRLDSINPAVDLGNAVSLHSGIPISIVDLDAARPPYSVALAGPDDSYVFNNAGQEIRLSGLPCFRDAEGPCANAVKDSMRTKTGPRTRRVLCILWGPKSLRDRVEAAREWIAELARRAGAGAEDVAIAR